MSKSTDASNLDKGSGGGDGENERQENRAFRIQSDALLNPEVERQTNKPLHSFT